MTQKVDVLKLQHQERKAKSAPVISEALIEAHISMIEAIAANITGHSKMPPGIEFSDLVNWGVEGFIKAYNNFDPNKGSQFKTYAFYRIRGEIFDKIRNEWRYRNPTDYREQRKKNQERIADLAEAELDRLETVPVNRIDESMNHLVASSAMACLMSIENMEIASEMAGTRDPQVELIDEKSTVLWDEIHALDDEEQRLVELFYVQGLKQKEIAEKLNVSRSTICRMHMKILEKLRRQLKGKI